MNRACNEVLEVLKYTSTEMLDMLPRNVWEKLESEKDRSYKYEYDKTKKLKEQTFLEETIDMLAYLYVNYWANATDKQEFKDLLVKKELNINN